MQIIIYMCTYILQYQYETGKYLTDVEMFKSYFASLF